MHSRFHGSDLLDVSLMLKHTGYIYRESLGDFPYYTVEVMLVRTPHLLVFHAYSDKGHHSKFVPEWIRTYFVPRVKLSLVIVGKVRIQRRLE